MSQSMSRADSVTASKMKRRGDNNNLLREVGEEAGIVDEIKQVLTKTQVGDAHDPHSWHESEVRDSQSQCSRECAARWTNG